MSHRLFENWLNVTNVSTSYHPRKWRKTLTQKHNRETRDKSQTISNWILEMTMQKVMVDFIKARKVDFKKESLYSREWIRLLKISKSKYTLY